MPSVRVVTQNLNFNLRPAHWRKIIGELTDVADVVLLQEAKNTKLEDFVPNDWAFTQHSREDGTAIMWRKSIGRYVASGIWMHTPKRRGVKMGARYISWVELVLKGDDRATRFASVHYPPGRFRRLWPITDRSTTAFIRQARSKRRRFVIGGDWNRHFGGANRWLARKLRVNIRGIRIDGFYISKDFVASRAVRGKNNASDHDPIHVTIRYP